MSNILYVGGDDSNHAGKNTKREFIVATFSLLHGDGLVKLFPNRRDYEFVSKWLENPKRDYRFTSRRSESYRHYSLNLPAIIPSLIDNFLNDNPLEINQINVYLDGWLNAESKRDLRDQVMYFPGIEKVVVANFIKKGKLGSSNGSCERGFSKRPFCPMVIYAADIIANDFYNYDGPISELLGHKKMIKGGGLFENL